MEELKAIYERMRAAFAAETGYTPNDGCDIMVRLYALAAEVQALLAQADWVLDQSFPQTAQESIWTAMRRCAALHGERRNGRKACCAFPHRRLRRQTLRLRQAARR